jgi:hypothetical protein
MRVTHRASRDDARAGLRPSSSERTSIIEAVRQWQFEPTTLNGTAVEVVMNVAITFELEE